MVKHRQALPRLLPGESLVKVETVKSNVDNFQRQPQGLHELYRLARTGDRGVVGDHGPVLASQVLEGHQSPSSLHLYEAIFGRDALRVALDLIDIYPTLAQATILSLARSQGVVDDPVSEEEPGRIIHEDRNPQKDPLARKLTKELGWRWPYYGSVDSTVEYIRTLTAFCRKPGRINLLNQTYVAKDGHNKTIADSLVAAVDWLINRLDANAEGLLEFRRANPKGIENQAWKDSWDAYFHKDGKMANHTSGVSSIEVQRVAFDTLLDAAEFYNFFLKRHTEANNLIKRAEKLKSMIMNKFWTDDGGGYFVLGTDRGQDGNLRQLLIKTSNMGHMLHSRVLLRGNGDEARLKREAIIRQLFSPKLLDASGIRTLATDEIRFRPGAYHNGSVWLWDNYLIAQGLALHGYHGLAAEVNNRLINTVIAVKQFPEFVRGDTSIKPTINSQVIDIWDESNQRVNRLEQPPQEVQAWTVAAFLSIQLKQRQAPSQAISGTPERQFEDDILSGIKSC